MINRLIFLFILFTAQIIFSNNLYSQYGLSEEAIQFTENWLEEVRKNVSEDDLLVATIVSQQAEPSLSYQLLPKALEVLDHDPILLVTAIRNCFSDLPIDACKNGSLFEELIEVDQTNLEPYLYNMLRLVESGDTERALEILNQGLEAPNHDIYYTEFESQVAQKFILLGYPAIEVSFPAGVYANAAANYVTYLKVLSTCTDQSISNNAWKLSCLFLGARLQNHSKGLMPKVFGGAIQRDVLIATEADQDVIDLVIEHNEWVGKVRDLANEKVDWLPTSPTSFEPDSFKREKKEITEFDALLRAIYRTQ